eukprot:TRINITY_DN58157_c0_g1_i1.p1 TRINITY_DN58157_c0_g1~~TRINITY_DN58157_c0_g1_i1.p1  ORF type:complete len:596 (+),score=103.18 TRINITY_DN58157_c0_g1_i1:97-1884(+)
MHGKDDSIGRSLDMLATCSSKLRRDVQALQRENEHLKASLGAAVPLPGMPCQPLFGQDASNKADADQDSKIASDGVSPLRGAAHMELDGTTSNSLDGKSTESWKAMSTIRFNEHAGMTLAAARLGMMTDAKHVWTTTPSPEQDFFRSGTWLHTFGGDIQKPLMERVARSLIFRAACISAIVANAVWITYESDKRVKDSFAKIEDEASPEKYVEVDITFSVFFVLELAIRIAGYRREFFCNEDYAWNLFDILLVGSSLAELLIPQVFNDFSYLRILRVFRLVRVIRVVKAVKALRSLRTMVFATINSFVALMWAFALIGLIIVITSILLLNGVASYYDKLSSSLPNDAMLDEAKEVNGSFGSLYECMISLYCAVTGGNDWMAYGSLLRKLDPSRELYFWVFMFYVGFCVVGLLNVVTGIFVDSAVTTRTEDEVVDSFNDEMQRRSQEIKRIFHEADVDGVGSLSFNQFKEHLESPWVRAYFSGLDIDPEEATIIFTLMDTDKNGRLSVNEFIDGTMKLKGSARSVDLLLLMYDNARFSVRLNSLCSLVEDELREIKENLLPGSVNDMRMFKPTSMLLEEVAEYRNGVPLEKVMTGL